MYKAGLESSNNTSFTNETSNVQFLRGYFDRHGRVFDIYRPYITMVSGNRSFLENVLTLTKTKGEIRDPDNDKNLYFLYLRGSNMLDFLQALYENSVRGERQVTKYLFYQKMTGYMPTVRFVLTDEKAMAPKKARFSDVCFDLAVIKEDTKIDPVTTLYDTGVAVQPEVGYWIEVVPRSSLAKTGYMMSNSIGVIDNSYTGNIKIALTKVNPDAKPIEFPFVRFQMIVRKQNFPRFKEVSSLDDTSRGMGGFGSTDSK